MKPHLFDLIANGYAWLAAVFVNITKEDVDVGLRITATASAIILTIVTLYYKIKRNGNDK